MLHCPNPAACPEHVITAPVPLDPPSYSLYCQKGYEGPAPLGQEDSNPCKPGSKGRKLFPFRVGAIHQETMKWFLVPGMSEDFPLNGGQPQKGFACSTGLPGLWCQLCASLACRARCSSCSSGYGRSDGSVLVCVPRQVATVPRHGWFCPGFPYTQT